MAEKETFSQPNYRISLLASNNLILVECNGYESQVFAPQIVNGRIRFLNIIPNRRCCQISKTNVMNLKFENIVKSKKLGRYSANECLGMSTPLANSTPAGVKQSHSSDSQLSRFYSRLSATDSTLPTPEPVRRAAPAQSMLLEKSANLPRAVKVSRIYYNSVEGTAKKVGRLVLSNSVRSSLNSNNISFLDGSFRLPCSPILPTLSDKENLSKTAVDCIARWKKVLTPIRTYARKTNKPVDINRPKTAESMKKSKRSSKFIPTYLYNPTQGLDVSQQIEMKKCKLIRDIKTKLSPRTFKMQQNQSIDIYTRKSKFSPHAHSLSLHKPRSYLDTIGMSAFDLLTCSNRNLTIARKLHDQFRRGCVNKASSTYSKYKVLSTVPLIKQDEQVLELSRISL